MYTLEELDTPVFKNGTILVYAGVAENKKYMKTFTFSELKLQVYFRVEFPEYVKQFEDVELYECENEYDLRTFTNWELMYKDDCFDEFFFLFVKEKLENFS